MPVRMRRPRQPMRQWRLRRQPSDSGAGLIALNDALDTLSSFDERKSRIVELRFFGGMTEEETAEAMEIPLRTLQREWNLARAWLYNCATRSGRQRRPAGGYLPRRVRAVSGSEKMTIVEAPGATLQKPVALPEAAATYCLPLIA